MRAPRGKALRWLEYRQRSSTIRSGFHRIENSPAQLREQRCAHQLLPLQGGGWEGNGVAAAESWQRLCPIPTPSLPLKGRERPFMRLPCVEQFFLSSVRRPAYDRKSRIRTTNIGDFSWSRRIGSPIRSWSISRSCNC